MRWLARYSCIRTSDHPGRGGRRSKEKGKEHQDDRIGQAARPSGAFSFKIIKGKSFIQNPAGIKGKKAENPAGSARPCGAPARNILVS
ncbi:MAG: hypothetical protein EBZ83_01065 [Verrucomicrobia bacterium]|nr:hypothetical protein [Verrucomicrobiota bacterium]